VNSGSGKKFIRSPGSTVVVSMSAKRSKKGVSGVVPGVSGDGGSNGCGKKSSLYRL